MKLKNLLWLLALTSISGSSLAIEKIIHFTSGNDTITGTLTLPDNVKNPPAVLILHGFTDQRDGQKTAYFQEGYLRYASKRWEDAGIASLRIDFMGSGESSGNYADTTLESQVEEAKEALTYLRNTGQVNGREISLLGHSQGGIVASAVSASPPFPLSSVILWNPGINPPAAYTAIFGEKVFNEGLTKGNQVFNAIRREDNVIIPLRGNFFESLYRITPAAEISRYKGPLLLAIGLQDAYVTPQPASANAMLKYHPGYHELWSKNVDHSFDISKTDNSYNELLDDTARFIRAH
ncbi:alpha/beta hydrolase family protein [Klebsiella michiganensis]|uniref:alpha/beta hydrolase family protein n=1 Tax=Klebsiella michiganensis TaxID=1134687 RepID=UPI00255054C2|nr:alpha/beta hydrolase [Klebsiella michiganensis]MDK9838554.1 lysophospholipase [Klebsiella michiganensis]